ncbi:nuclear transport factor 2 family protein [Shewanella sp. Scap07]|uniref:YybH family protein n=1 Tax=Shewanella sp. Scap07 TaxID=2589987 RepID=UPI0015B7EA63|nr:nuclear transport factor 2 family protein [Shewanella sp. Scap07]QLE83733.1 nuclear transport factor 2 family protein [Shewanella sp. Scap07]
MIKKAIGLFVLFIAASVQAVPSDDIAEILSQQEAAWNRGDLDNYMRGYWNNEKMRFVSGNKFSYGWEKTLAAYKKNYPNAAALGQLKFTIEETKMLSNYAALVVGRWELKRAKDNPNGVFTLLVERIDDRWVITHDHSSD